MISPDRLVKRAGRIKENIATSLDPIMNRHSMLTLAGISGFVSLKIATLALSETPIPQPHDFTTLATTLPFAYPIFKGAIGNLQEYFCDGKTFSLAKTRRDRVQMVFGGYASLHFAGEYAQVLAYALGGSDFGQGFYGHDFNQFFFDPHMIPYWAFNAPGFYLLGKAMVSEVKSCVSGVIGQIQMVRSLAKQQRDDTSSKNVIN